MRHADQFRIPVNPVLSPASFSAQPLEEGLSATSIVDGRRALPVTGGRFALAHILRDIDVGEGDSVLLPAYHCLSMVSPVQTLGAEPVYYRLHDDLSPDFDDLEQKLAPEVRCVLFVHYFGFPADVDRQVKFASRHSLPMIEDCAHTYFGSYRGQKLGSFGDYAFCSPWKFLPVFDGGYALSRNDSLEVGVLGGAGARFQVKALVNLVENSVATGRFGLLGRLLRALLNLKDRVRGRPADGAQRATGSAPPTSEGSSEFDRRWANIRMSRVSGFLLRYLSPARAVRGRRDNYRRLLAAFPATTDCRPLYPELPPDVVPYVFPLYVAGGDAVYHRLRDMKIPVFRWDDIPEGECPVSSDYRDRLIQLPVHQELSARELQRTVGGVREALDRTKL